MFFVLSTLSWDSAVFNLSRIQSRLYKCVYVFDMDKALFIQKSIFRSSTACLLAIRNITQIDWLRKIAGIDGKIYISFIDRFVLNEIIKEKFFYWVPSRIKLVNILRVDGTVFSLNLLTIGDRVWQCLFRFGLEPAHEASFSARNLGFRPGLFVYDLQRTFFYNLNASSFGFQKRILIIKLGEKFSRFNYNSLLRKLIVTRCLKLTVFRFFKVGFFPSFTYSLKDNFYLDSLIANILFDGIESLHSSVRFGGDVAFFLKPKQNENRVFRQLFKFLDGLLLDLRFLKFYVFNSSKGFDFLDWHFKLVSNSNFACFPSYSSYKNFLLRVKNILNNSNYGVGVKVLKVRPIIKQWFVYNSFSNLQSNQYALFFLKRRAFKIFNSESKQDKYSSKRLVDICFDFKSLSDLHFVVKHKSFWFNYLSINSNSNYIFSVYYNVKDYYCIFCGIRISH
uniref:Ycf13 n=1 Tax=Trachelomonas grandis TaxID=215769 RepID=A0A385UJZ6_9EUGL|nr:Ycf13 [Trachelomonas grandis]